MFQLKIMSKSSKVGKTMENLLQFNVSHEEFSPNFGYLSIICNNLASFGKHLNFSLALAPA